MKTPLIIIGVVIFIAAALLFSLQEFTLSSIEVR